MVANELLDNLPFRLAVHDGGWREACVDVDADGRLVEVLVPVADGPGLPAVGGGRTAPGRPVQDEAAALGRATRSARLERRAGSW